MKITVETSQGVTLLEYDQGHADPEGGPSEGDVLVAFGKAIDRYIHLRRVARAAEEENRLPPNMRPASELSPGDALEQGFRDGEAVERIREKETP